MARTPQKKGPQREGKSSRPAAPPPPVAWQPEPAKKAVVVERPAEAVVAEAVAAEPAVAETVVAEPAVGDQPAAEVAALADEPATQEAPVPETPAKEPPEPARVFETVLSIPMPMPMEVVMGKLTNDMKRLHDEIVSARSQRNALNASNRKASEARHASVNEMMSSFHKGRMDAFRQAQAVRTKALTNLRNHVATLQRDMSADLAGARRAFRGN